MTTSNIPDGISFDDLKALANGATEQPTEQGPYGGLTREELCAQAQAARNAIDEIVTHPLAHKMIVMDIIDRMIDWHSKVGVQDIEESNNTASAVGWLRDAGKFQAVQNLLMNISVDNADFTTVFYQEPEA